LLTGTTPDDPDAVSRLHLAQAEPLDGLTGSSAADRRRERHAAYYQDFVKAAREGSEGTDQFGWLEQLYREHDNLRTAMRWLLDHGRLDRFAGIFVLWSLMIGKLAAPPRRPRVMVGSTTATSAASFDQPGASNPSMEKSMHHCHEAPTQNTKSACSPRILVLSSVMHECSTSCWSSRGHWTGSREWLDGLTADLTSTSRC